MTYYPELINILFLLSDKNLPYLFLFIIFDICFFFNKILLKYADLSFHSVKKGL